MRQRSSVLVLLAVIAISAQVRSVAAQTGCEGTSGSALINGTPWSTVCVIAATSPACIDSMGQDYECFQILGSDSSGTYTAIGIFLAHEPVQGQTYDLGGTSAHDAVVLGQAGLWLTGDDPYTGQVEITVYDPAQSILECNFSFTAQSLFFGADVAVTNGSFVGRIVVIEPVEPRTWSDVKTLYRASPH